MSELVVEVEQWRSAFTHSIDTQDLKINDMVEREGGREGRREREGKRGKEREGRRGEARRKGEREGECIQGAQSTVDHGRNVSLSTNGREEEQ